MNEEIKKEKLIKILSDGLRYARSMMNDYGCDFYIGDLADYLLNKGTIIPPCKIGDTVYLTLIDKINEDGNPSFKIEQGTVYKIEVDNTKDTIWIGANFGILHCCRPYTDFFYTKEDAKKDIENIKERYKKC